MNRHTRILTLHRSAGHTARTPFATILPGRLRLAPALAAFAGTLLLFMSPAGIAQMDPPPEPSSSSMIGDTVTNPVTGMTTTVSGLVVDPAGTPTEGATAWVQTADGYAFLVKAAGESIYNDDTPPFEFVIVSIDTMNNTAAIDPIEDPPVSGTENVNTRLLESERQDLFSSNAPPPEVTPPVVVTGASGVRRVSRGDGGSNGRAGALFVPPSSGGRGQNGPAVTYTNTINISTTNQIGIEAGSVGGNGGRGGDSILSFWSGRPGGNGGDGGPVTVTNGSADPNQPLYQVATTGDDSHGIFAYSRSGRAGRGGDGILAPSGGAGGRGGSGGPVTVTNNGNIITTGDRAFGIYGLSQSSNGGDGGSQWGLVGSSGSGFPGGNGGAINITNGSRGTIQTSGDFSHGILGLSVGGTGGSSGTSGNLILALPGQGDAGGSGGPVTVTNNGGILTGGNFARGIFAQSIGGGGGNGGAGGGLISIGGAGDGGGSSGTVTVTNNATGIIMTSGTQSDGIFAQSVGGSGGSGSSGGGLVAIGGAGSRAGSGGNVTVRNFGTITTGGDIARGIVAQSIGGGGGDGGNTGGLVSVGGRAGPGGAGGLVRVTQGGTIETAGRDAPGIFTQSVGGGGGNGGSAGSVSAFVGVAVGGRGGSGGTGGNVEVTLQGASATQASRIVTQGDRSTGLFAQSVGGGGGNGGGAVQVTGGFVGAVSIAVGGSGGVAGNGGTVTVNEGNDVSIVETRGDDATAVFLQSVGGGGGNGGYAVSVAASAGPASGSLSVGVGGRGGAGGAGGTVRIGTFDGAGNLTSNGLNASILTTGERSPGLIAQSVGGGGGNGGLAVSASAAIGATVGVGVSVGVGGDGGGGGTGGTVSVGTQGNVTTEQAFSPGMLVQSVGGGGGNGGGAISGALGGGGTAGISLGVGTGGSGGAGNAGGTVTLATLGGTVSTGGESSTGITAQSIGGGGGNGGYSVAIGVGGGGAAAGAISVGLGGSGGGGGTGGLVRADLQSDVITQGANSTGILVQSVGGSGGNGGFNVTAGGAIGGTGAGTVGVGIGGDGALGGVGGTVTASSTGAITTAGENSSGFIAQSIGGGGGNGGFNVTGTLAGGGSASGAVSVGLGGKGGGGVSAGSVTASTSGDVQTGGANSTGILAQSVGGGGGNGGFNVSVALSGAGTGSGAVGVGLGGDGAGGGDASTVDLTVNNNVSTMGNDSSAVIAQSVGGGGGNGGFNVSVSGSGAGTGSVGVGVGLGGSGAGGGDGAGVTSTMTGDIATMGENSNGLVAQSVGGGGGNGGFNVTAAISVAGTASGAVGVGLGGSGGGGGDGGTVNSSLTGNVVTGGEFATGVTAQSLGGGGGNGGFNVSGSISGAGTGSAGVSVGIGGSGGSGGDSTAVMNTVTGDVTTSGVGADGVVAQSLGGGGGNGGFNISAAISGAGTASGAVSVGIGGSGGSGGNAGDADAGADTSTVVVTNTVTGNVTTASTDATGVVAQAIGGGGGNGGFNVSGTISGAGTGGGAVSVGIGGSGGGGGFAGSVVNTVVGDVTTAGAGSEGVFAQSLGGGGGNGGFNVSGAISGNGTGGGAVSVGIGGSGGGGGSAGNVDNTVTGNVTTASSEASGVVAQSLGGGGGNGGFNVSGTLSVAGTGSFGASVGIGGSGGGGGSAGNVDSTVTGDVTTAGSGSTGVLAQSVGGGGGNGAFNVSAAVSGANTGAGAVSVGIGGSGGGGGGAGAVSSTVTGNVLTAGSDAYGIIAQSLGGGGGNGAFNVTASVAAAGSGGGTVGVGVGGAGGGGGAGGAASAAVTGDITTLQSGSAGLLVQSVGGGGGNGATNVTAGLTVSGSGAGTVGVGVGGFGGGGGAGGAVDGSLVGNVSTAGDDSYGALLQSLGGGGGNGGVNVTAGMTMSKSGSGTLAVGVGGFGGGGGDASTVDASVDGTVNTNGDGAFGVMAQSLGGGGGNGGVNVSGALNLSLQTSGSVAAGVGGFGGQGGASSDVTLTRSGTTATQGANSDAVVAQSIGGGGGQGGLNVSAGVSGSTQGTSLSAALGLGGFGGSGGNAGNVNATVTGDVFATGFESDTTVTTDDLEQRVISGGSSGIIAQSVGGSGGNGGLNVSAGIALTKPGMDATGSALTLGVGGFGGGAGNAGTVTLDVTADDVSSIGDNQSAIVAQSIGGGGGDGGINVSGGITLDGAVTVGVGGSGSGGGTGADVTATVDAALVTATGTASRGIVAQSVGGGGGNGGINVSGGISLDRAGQTSLPSLVFGMGGAGGAGNTSGNVSATQAGTVDVEGVNSIGVLVQSIAGGGGAGALNVSGNLAAGEGFAAVAGVGGAGGLGSDAGSASLVSDGAIDVSGVSLSDIDPADEMFTRFGDRANGILVQSVGGGGGQGGANISGVVTRGNPVAVNVGSSGGGGGNAGVVNVVRGATEAALLQTHGDQANALTAQSIGGGGGDAGMNLQFAVSGVATNNDDPLSAMITIGGAGGDPGHGAATSVAHTGTIMTGGNQSVGIMAQSVGGGGGNANLNVALGYNKGSSGFNLAVGGAPGEGGDGGVVAVTHSGDIMTLGDDSAAIFAQSVGGGGGNAAMNMATSIGSSNGLNIGVGRVGGTGGIGNDVAVASSGMLLTSGDRATGVLAQSVGNGGGNSGTTSVGFSRSTGEGDAARSTGVNVAVGLEGGMGGRSGDVDVSTSGLVMTEGEQAHGVHAQSVGGGGGIGGAATNIVFRETTTARLGIGGAGGMGGVSGAVTVTNDAVVATAGGQAHGIYAQSIGGGGGTGGYAGVIAIQAGGAAANGNNSMGVSVGGSGGIGAAAGAVTVANSGTVEVAGDSATGVTAQSIGGGGGDGGIVLNGTLAGAGRNNAMTVGIGGTAGDGGISAAVAVTNDGLIMTSGQDGIGIRAQSIGGGGGNAGLLANLDINRGETESSSRTVTLNIGGSGGTGGVAGDVSVVNRAAADGSGGMIVTSGNDAHGILAQSIGGGGGNGSSIVSGRFSRGRNATLTSLNVGGFGGDGGTAGTVTIDNSALIDTSGSGAHGVLAQSIGGGGGNGGMVIAINKTFGSAKKAQDSATAGSDRMMSVGGVGGTGSDAGEVVVNNSGQIVTRGENAHGIYAQSIGGGGGNTGMSFGKNTNKAVTGVVKKIVGALGGDGGLGGEVTVNHSGDITVMGDGSQAIKAESINGGGGSTAIDFNGIVGIPGGAALPPIPGVGPITGFEDVPVLELRLGGEQQLDSNAANVTINNTGTFGVFGNNGAGSGSLGVGGGGGSATVNVDLDDGDLEDGETSVPIDVLVDIGGLDGQNNAGSTVASRHDGDIMTVGRNSHGVAIHSIGGGGGRASYAFTGNGDLLGSLDYRLGATNGTNETGGGVSHRQSGDVVTEGDLSHGMLVSSVGGGGGSLSLLFDFDDPQAASSAGTASSKISAPSARVGSAQVALGSSGGSGLDGGTVDVDHIGNIVTTADLSAGLVQQSIGAGGGEVRASGVEGLAVTLGASGGASGDGGDVDLLLRENVTTFGDRSHGIVLQSIGGGGGAVFTDTGPVDVTLSADNAGDGGVLRAVLLRDVQTQGDESHGLIAQSLGGGGGFVDGAFIGSAGGSGSGAAVDLEVAGDMVTTGSGSSALLAQSLGGNGAGDIRVSLSANRMIVGGAGGTGIAMDGGVDNLVINRGLITTMDGIDGFAITSTSGNDTISNEGELVGNVDLGGGSNAIDNAIGALFETGSSVGLGGPGSLLSSGGTVSPGGAGRALTTNLDGSYLQTADGTFFIELDFATNSLDAMLATGSVTVDGDIVLDRLNTHKVKPGTFTRRVLRGENGLVNNGVNYVFAPSVVVTNRFAETSTAINMEYTVDFSPSTLFGGRRSTGNYFNRAQAVGSSNALADTIVELVAIGDIDTYDNALTQLSPDVYAEQMAQTLTASQEFLRSVRERCDVSDAYSVSQGDNCVWLRYDVKDMDRDFTDGFPAFSGDARRYSVGLQHRFASGSIFGAGLAVDDTDFAGFGDRWAASGRTVQLSAMQRFALNETAGLTFQASIGESAYDTVRRIDVTESFLAESERDVFFFNAVAGISEQWQAGAFRFNPSFDIGASYVSADPLVESGAGAQSLRIDETSDIHMWITPSIEMTRGFTLGNNIVVEGYARVGLQYYLDGPDTFVEGILLGAPGGIGSMVSGSDLDEAHGIYGAGIRALSGRMRFSLSYDHDESNNRRLTGVNGKLVFVF